MIDAVDVGHHVQGEDAYADGAAGKQVMDRECRWTGWRTGLPTGTGRGGNRDERA